MLNNNRNILSNIAKVEYYYSPDNIEVKNKCITSNTVQVNICHPCKIYDYCLCTDLCINNFTKPSICIRNIIYNASICDYYLESINGIKNICVQIALYKYMYYTTCYSDYIECCDSVQYLSYKLPTDSYYINYLDVQAIWMNTKDCNTLIRFIVN